MSHLEYEDGSHIRDRNARMADAKAAYERYLARKKREAQEAARKASGGGRRARAAANARKVRLENGESKPSESEGDSTERKDGPSGEM